MEFAKACEVQSWNHRTSTPHRSETTGIAERAVRRVNEGTSAVFATVSQYWMKSGGQASWNAIAVCEMSKTSWQMGKRHTKDDLNHSKGQEYLLEQARIHRFGKRVSPGIFLGFELTAGEFGMEMF